MFNNSGKVTAKSRNQKSKNIALAMAFPLALLAPTMSMAAIAAKCAPAPATTLVVNVKDTGAKGDGIANDTVAIQAAIDRVAPTGGTVLVPNGVYMVDGIRYLRLKSNITFKMDKGTLLKVIPNSSNSYSTLRLQDVSNVNIIGGTLQGERDQHTGTTGEWGMGVDIRNSKNIVIEDVTSRDMWGDGFYVTGAASANIVACNVTADNNRRQGMSITSVDGAVIKNSVFKNTNGTLPSAGIDIEPNPNDRINNVQILNSVFNNNAGAGILSTFYNSTDHVGAITTNLVIANNSVYNNGTVGKYSAGIQLSSQISPKVMNNIVVNSTHDGISLTHGTTGSLLSGNTVIGSGYGNKTDKNIGNGILFYLAPGNTATKNIVTGNINPLTGKIMNIVDAARNNTVTQNITD